MEVVLAEQALQFLVPQAVEAQSVLCGPAIHVHSHQLVQVRPDAVL